MILLLSGCDLDDYMTDLRMECESAATTQKSMLRLINEARSIPKQCGDEYFGSAPEVVWNATLEAAAKSHSSDMAKNNFGFNIC